MKGTASCPSGSPHAFEEEGTAFFSDRSNISFNGDRRTRPSLNPLCYWAVRRLSSNGLNTVSLFFEIAWWEVPHEGGANGSIEPRVTRASAVETAGPPGM